MLETARNIKNLAGNRPIILCLSGGIDSEVIALSFMECGIEFTVLTCVFENNSNVHDIVYANNFCKKHNLTQQFFNINHLEFFTEEYKKYIDRGYRAIKLYRYFQLLLLETIENMGGCAVLGNGDPRYYQVNGISCIKYTPEFTYPIEWCKNNNTIHFPYFFQQNPNLLASYMKTEIIDFLLDRPRYFPDFETLSLEKMILYHSVWPELARRRKYTGFENFQDERIRVELDLMKQFPDIEPLTIPISTVKLQLGI